MPNSILVVDDNSLVRQALRSLFSFDGFFVCGEAGNGVQAIEKAKRMQPDIIVLDFTMPVMDGIRAAKALKHIMPDVPLILFSVHASSALEKEALAAGIDAVVSKQDASGLTAKAQELLRAKVASLVNGKLGP